MKSKTVLCAITALALVAGQCALAQGDPRGGNYGQQGQRDDNRNNRGNDNNRNRDNGADHRNNGRAYGDERGAGPDHQFRRGDRLPDQYRNRQYVVDDWRGHHLSQPPRGYHWVQSGSDYVLVAIATGVILNLLLSH